MSNLSLSLALGFLAMSCSAAEVPAGLQPDFTSQASASAGVFADTKYLSTAAGPLPAADFVANRTLLIHLYVSGTSETGANYIVQYKNGTTEGWYLYTAYGFKNVYLYVAGIGGLQITNRSMVRGANVIAITRLANGTIRCSMNGSAPAQMTTNAAYTPGGASAVFRIGRDATAGQAAVSIEVIRIQMIGESKDDTWLLAQSQVAESVNRFTPSDGDPNALWDWIPALDFTAGAGTSIAGRGSAPFTMNVTGAVAKNTLAAENIYVIPDSAIYDTTQIINKTAATYGGAYKSITSYGQVGFITDAPRFSVDIVGDAATGVMGYGAYSDSTYLSPKPIFVYNDRLIGSDINGLSALSKTVTIQSGGSVGPSMTATNFARVRVPVGSDFEWAAVPQKSDQIIVIGDSIGSMGYGADEPYNPVGGAIIPQLRVQFPGSSIAAIGFYGATLNTVGGTPSARADILARIAFAMASSGASSLRVVMTIGTNDWGGGASAATFSVYFNAVLAAILGAYPNARITLISPLHRSGDLNANAGGSTIADYLAVEQAAAAADPTHIHSINGFTLTNDTSGAHLHHVADLLHLSSAGYTALATGVTAALNAW